MQRYTRLFLIVLGTALAAFVAFNAFVDPYDTGTGPDIEGLTANKTRAHEDGRRVQVGHAIGQVEAGTLITGSSRTVDGFPMEVGDWPGGLYNAGIRGSNAFELAHLAAIAGQDPGLRCFIVGLDMGEFASGEKYKPAFPISRLADGRRWLATARVTLSPNTFARAVQTVSENVTATAPQPPFRDVYEAGEQYRRFMNTPVPTLRYYSAMRMSDERMDFLFEALASLAREGVQVIGFLQPVHAWNEESLFAAGRADEYFDFRAEMARRFAALAEAGSPVNACVPGQAGVLWDFTGYQPPSTTPLPEPDQTATHPVYHEPAHYLPALGLEMLSVMQSGEAQDGFGVNLSRTDPRDSEAGILARREAYLATPEGEALQALLEPALSERGARGWQSVSISHAEWRSLIALNAAIASHRERQEALAMASED
ncbi:MAG: hypothetical protein HLUCCA04_04050 [Oceanicaulis sp. HLUCCA04]|nr:MAG: hypothetical protein HLUCCA04_04050 [Oceanicaulis sp. HLUCCA04]